MRIIKIITLFLLSLVLINCEKDEIPNWTNDFDISVMSFNIRYDTEEDGDNKWDNRKQACLDMLTEIEPTVFGIQEGLHNQVSFLDRNLSDYDYIGVGRDDGHSSGEYAAIFYSTQHLELLDDGNFWLSETPDEPSLGWDANNIRIVTWAKLKLTSKNKIFYVFNTHFDHKGKTAQEEASKLLAQKITEIAGEESVFIIGDFNMLKGNSRLEPITNTYLDAREDAPELDKNKSFNAWGKWYIYRNIDFIFYKNAETLSFRTVIKDYGVPFISDHYPLIGYFDF